jgi:hypothetical protein
MHLQELIGKVVQLNMLNGSDPISFKRRIVKITIKMSNEHSFQSWHDTANDDIWLHLEKIPKYQDLKQQKQDNDDSSIMVISYKHLSDKSLVKQIEDINFLENKPLTPHSTLRKTRHGWMYSVELLDPYAGITYDGKVFSLRSKEESMDNIDVLDQAFEEAHAMHSKNDNK